MSFAANVAKTSGLCGLLETEMNGTLKKGRGATETQSILVQAYLLPIYEGHLSDLDDIRHGPVFRMLTVLGAMLCLRRIEEFLCRFLGKRSRFDFENCRCAGWSVVAGALIPTRHSKRRNLMLSLRQ